MVRKTKEKADASLSNEEGGAKSVSPADAKMVDVRLLVSRAGIGFSQNRGDQVSVSQGEAIRMIEAGQAEPVRAVTAEQAVRTSRTEQAEK